jgi:hypothetical protein
MFGIFLPDVDYLDYDHIVPAVGIRYRNENEYDSDDELICYDLYEDEKIEKHMNEEEFGSTRRAIHTKEDADDGCLPLDVSFLFVTSSLKMKQKLKNGVFLGRLWNCYYRYHR